MASAAFKTWASVNVRDVLAYLHLQDWRVNCEFDGEDEDIDSGSSTVAYAVTDCDYFKATFTFTKFAEDLWKHKEYETLFQCLAHEVCHIWTEPLRMLALRSTSPATAEQLVTAHEQLTQRIALLVLRGIPEKSYTPKK